MTDFPSLTQSRLSDRWNLVALPRQRVIIKSLLVSMIMLNYRHVEFNLNSLLGADLISLRRFCQFILPALIPFAKQRGEIFEERFLVPSRSVDH
jgi:hypothetical protein